jgi:hypothetical protein
MTDDVLWTQQHIEALRRQRRWNWETAVTAFEHSFLCAS